MTLMWNLSHISNHRSEGTQRNVLSQESYLKQYIYVAITNSFSCLDLITGYVLNWKLNKLIQTLEQFIPSQSLIWAKTRYAH